ncbi:MAG TPA: Kdo hydroxylase family protein [Gemmataceae bacterium]|jgi:hypothetical protein|nr:Kdo hydroxylase family protein [Gemmataceae bacterium]
MEANHVPAGEDAAGTPEQRLERGGVLLYPAAPFPLPAGDDLTFLLAQELGGRVHKNIGYDPATGRVSGFARRGGDQAERLRSIFAAFSAAATAWTARTFPRYAGGWELDRCSYRPQEEATRRLRQTARNDLLHVDAFPNRPSRGHRILRVFANINPRDPRIWVTSDPFAKLLQRYGAAAGLPGGHPVSWLREMGEGMIGLFRPHRARRSAYDSFMLRFHDFLKKNDEFQERGPKRLWAFPPGSVWVAMTDTCSHSVLRGRYALEHSYFIAPSAQALPRESPPALLEAACAAARAA